MPASAPFGPRQCVRSSYTFGMKTAISVPDEVFESGERLAKRLKVSRSQLYSEAVAEYVERRSPDHIVEGLNSVCAEVQHQRDAFVGKAARRVLEQSEW